MKQQNILLIITLIVVCAFCRLIPHMPNFTPYIGVALFGGAYIKDLKWAILLPTLSLYLSDLIINNTVSRHYFTQVEGIVWASPYMAFNLLSTIVFIMIARASLKHVNISSVVGSSLLSAVCFFLISNFGVWLSSEVTYQKTFSGLMLCYTAAIPFFGATLMSALLTSAVLFGSYLAIVRLTSAELAIEK